MADGPIGVITSAPTAPLAAFCSSGVSPAKTYASIIERPVGTSHPGLQNFDKMPN
jgi:hypothetical protein